MDQRLVRLEAENFRSLRKVTLPLGDVNVLVGPNGAGKTNVLRVLDFLARIARTDLEPALNDLGGFGEVAFRGGDNPPASIKIKVAATWTADRGLNAPDEYELRITRSTRAGAAPALERSEAFSFKRAQGRERRITIAGEMASVVDAGREGAEQREHSIGIRRLSSGLSTLPRCQTMSMAPRSPSSPITWHRSGSSTSNRTRHASHRQYVVTVSRWRRTPATWQDSSSVSRRATSAPGIRWPKTLPKSSRSYEISISLRRQEPLAKSRSSCTKPACAGQRS